MIQQSKQLFNLGQIVATPGAIATFERVDELMVALLSRHVRGDWGVLHEEDKTANDEAVTEGFRILSAYKLSDGTKIWIITEGDRSSTTILLPEEY
ncbi:hypothetical protein Pla110_22000 [Polystyrenella longa]|uniref:Plasmid related protein n=1 Tax=Polystyrenella longa TaxID=2528007 RepID=A0A518CML6_9PLAN|nr:hypothetical protein [Polystyrenella longa]QDU80470.1 hypothetical protein Pla110_22000 [Polystyrenella longa]